MNKGLAPFLAHKFAGLVGAVLRPAYGQLPVVFIFNAYNVAGLKKTNYFGNAYQQKA